MYKTVDLFGNEQTILEQSKTRIHKKDFTDYDGFVDKFKTLKTTDDCYTPENVFRVILDYVDSKYSLDGKRIIRPFYPDGDYKSIDYTPECVVIDNPPFSIISEIAKFYVSRKIPFFLFAPHMTLFTSDMDCTYLVVGANIIYANGANVKTSFLSNMLGDAKITGDADLYKILKSVIGKDKVNLPKYEYPPNVLTVSMVSNIVEKGVSINIGKSHAKHCRQLADQKNMVKLYLVVVF